MSLAHVGAAGFSDKVGALAEFIGGCGAGRMSLRNSAQRNSDPLCLYADRSGRSENRIIHRHLAKFWSYAVFKRKA